MSVVLRQVDPVGKSLVLPGFAVDGQPHLSGGVGGWSEVARPRTTAGSRWDGYPLFRWDGSPVWRATSSGADVAAPLAQLRAWGINVKPGTQPPVLQLAGLGYDRLRWVLDTLDVDPATAAYTADWRPQLLVVRLQLMEYRGLTVTPSPADSVRSQLLESKTGTRVVVVAKGDTLRSVAARYLHDGNRWREINKLNPSLRDPNRRFTAPHHLTIPAR